MMGYKVYDSDGQHIGGDAVLDEAVRGAALLANGWVADAADAVVYESPRRREVLAEAARRGYPDGSPSSEWTVAEIDSWARDHEITLSGRKAEKLARIAELGRGA